MAPETSTSSPGYWHVYAPSSYATTVSVEFWRDPRDSYHRYRSELVRDFAADLERAKRHNACLWLSREAARVPDSEMPLVPVIKGEGVRISRDFRMVHRMRHCHA